VSESNQDPLSESFYRKWSRSGRAPPDDPSDASAKKCEFNGFIRT